VIGRGSRGEVQGGGSVGLNHDEPATGGQASSLLKRWGREPLPHFLMAELALFVDLDRCLHAAFTVIRLRR
jgi:hypothetical protein